MPALSLNRLLGLRRVAVRTKRALYVRVFGMDLDPTVEFSLSCILDLTHPAGVHVGPRTWIARGSHIFTHDRTRGLYVDTWIGRDCFVGAHSIVLPGVRVGDECIVAAGAVVTRDVPPRSIVAGNPAVVIRSDIEVGAYGRLATADETTRRLEAEGLVRYKPRVRSRRRGAVGPESST